MDTHLPLLSGNYYHIYNRGNNGENLFYRKDNYHYFLKQYDHYLSEYLETFAYCLLPNHFHLLVKIREADTSKEGLKRGTAVLTEPDVIVSELFRRFFTSYAKAINKDQHRTGSLFQKIFKRKLVDNPHYFNQLVYYIHANPQRHDIIDDFKAYPYSSYGSLLSEKPTKLLRNDVIGWFGGSLNYKKYHDLKHYSRDINKWIIEED